MTTKAIQKLIDTFGPQIQAQLPVLNKDVDIIIKKAIEGGECTPAGFEAWLHQRLLPNCVLIDEVGYTKMCVNALKILDNAAATDYGSSRQRDLGQQWADMTRGYLGEYAFKLFLAEHSGLEAQLGHDIGDLDEFLPTDIHLIRDKQTENPYRAPKLNISVKTSKWNGIWLDIPGNQFAHSDAHVFVKVGTGRDHLFAFFKHISVFKDKILRRGQEVGSLTVEESDRLFDALPSFQPIPAYICGFVWRDAAYEALSYGGKMGRKNYTITTWQGPISGGDMAQVKAREGVSGKVTFAGIGRFSHETGYLFNTGSLLWSEQDWQKLFARL